MPIEQLEGNPRNSKGHDVGGIRDSMGRFGVIDVITLDERTGLIVSGHGRRDGFLEAKAEGQTPPEGITVAEDGTWLTPVVRGWESANDVEALAAAIAVNEYVIKGGWDQMGLADVLSEINRTEGAGLAGTGWTEDSLSDLLARVGGPPDLDDLADEIGEPADDDFWPTLHFKVPPDLRDRFLALVAGVDGEADQFAHLVTLAEEANE